MGSYSEAIYQVAVGHALNDHRSYAEIDCSHFVRDVIQEATQTSIPYTQANDFRSSPLFRKVDTPLRGDIVYWEKSPHGHVGIVMDPVGNEFLGSQSHGPGLDRYTSSYWRSHGGGPQFLQYTG